MESLSRENILRLYTLNYDQNFKILLERMGLSVFDGFDIEYGNYLKANVREILDNMECHAHYNLHGSIFWEVLKPEDRDIDPEIVLMQHGFNLQVNNSPHSVQLEKGKTLSVANIITGYQKAQRGVMPPFNQMKSTFDKDCCFADEMYIVGYSFGDEHINQSIKTALKHNKEIKITMVSPDFINKDMNIDAIKKSKEVELFGKIFPYSNKEFSLPKKIDENVYSYLEGNFEVYNIGFEEFLKYKTGISV